MVTVNMAEIELAFYTGTVDLLWIKSIAKLAAPDDDSVTADQIMACVESNDIELSRTKLDRILRNNKKCGFWEIDKNGALWFK